MSAADIAARIVLEVLADAPQRSPKGRTAALELERRGWTLLAEQRRINRRERMALWAWTGAWLLSAPRKSFVEVGSVV